MCQSVLTTHPEHPDALNLCGVACFQAGDAEQATSLLEKAVAHRPEFIDAHNNLGNVLKAVGRLVEAESSYRRAIAIEPRYFDAHFNLGIVLEAMDRPGEAEATYRRALALRPDFVPAHLNIGNALKALGRFDEALDAYGRVLDGEPRHVDALNNLGTVLYELGKLADAESTYRRALEVDERHADAHYNLGVVLQEMKNYDESIAEYRRAVEIRPHYAEGYVNLGYALHQAGNLQEAHTAYERTIELDPDNPQVHVNLGDLLLHGGDPGAAVALCDTFLETHPGETAILAFKSVALHELGDREAARYLADFDGLLRSTSFEAPDGFASPAEFNAALAEHICAHPSLVSAPASHATREGKHSGELLIEPKGPMSAWEELLGHAVEEYRRSLPTDSPHPFVRKMPAGYKLTAWGVVLEAQGHQVPHIHPSAWLSGVYYVEVPAVAAVPEEKPAGWIEFGRPPEHFHTRATPDLKLVQPREGLLLLFPSYFYHRTVPFETGGRRISIAFDVLPRRAA